MIYTTSLLCLFSSLTSLTYARPQVNNDIGIVPVRSLQANSSNAGPSFESMVLESIEVINHYYRSSHIVMIKGSLLQNRPIQGGDKASDFKVVRTTALDDNMQDLITTRNYPDHQEQFLPPLITPLTREQAENFHLRTIQWNQLGCNLDFAIEKLKDLRYAADWLEVRVLSPLVDFIKGTAAFKEIWFAFLRLEAPQEIWIVYGTRTGRTALITGDITGGINGLQVEVIAGTNSTNNIASS